MSNPFVDIVNFGIGLLQGPQTGQSAVSQGAADASGSIDASVPGVAAFSAFFAYLTNVAMWRSLGWLLLGVAMMILGVALLLRKSVETTIGAAAL
jgi:hypothetical protein